MLVVKKFGGTSVADKERIFNVAKRIKEEYNKDEIVGYYRKNILEGKRLNGEAEDFNY